MAEIQMQKWLVQFNQVKYQDRVTCLWGLNGWNTNNTVRGCYIMNISCIWLLVNCYLILSKATH